MSALNDILIQQLNVKANINDAKDLIHDFENASWSTTPKDQWLFVRKLDVKGKKQELRLQASCAIDSAYREAVDGGGSASSQSNAVRFKNLPELLTFLLRDICSGDAVFRWYWQRWSYLFRESKKNAITKIFWENAQLLPALIEKLNEIHCLEKVWKELDSRAAEVIYQKVISLLPQVTKVAQEKRDKVNEEANIANRINTIFRKNKSITLPWIRIFNEIDYSDFRLNLAAAIVGMHYFPTDFAKMPDLFFRAFCQGVSYECDARLAIDKKLRELTDTEKRKAVPLTQKRENAELRKVFLNKVSEPCLKKIKNRKPESETFRESAESKPSRLNNQNAVEAEKAKNRKDQEKNNNNKVLFKELSLHKEEELIEKSEGYQDEAYSQLDYLTGAEFSTQFGGVFYLINALRPYQEALMKMDSATHINIGWRWLFDVARRFNQRPNQRLNQSMDVPLMRFFAQQFGMDDYSELECLPLLSEMDWLISKLENRYQTLWAASLMEVPAVVVYTSSHIDCFMPLSSVDLAVRLKGLDINPGWVPWLSKVVSFHFRDSCQTNVKSHKGEGDNA